MRKNQRLLLAHINLAGQYLQFHTKLIDDRRRQLVLLSDALAAEQYDKTVNKVNG